MERVAIADRLQEVAAGVLEARERGFGQAVAIVAVTKTVSPAQILDAYRSGQRLFGENRVQEATAKQSALAGEVPGAQWHLLGHLQTNKVNRAFGAFSLIQSVDSLKLGMALSRASIRAQRVTEVLLEVNVAGESSKYGFSMRELDIAIREFATFSNLRVRGLMTIAPQVQEPDDVRLVFRSLRELRDRLSESQAMPELTELSMGMSQDYKIAVEEGATIIRIGRALFGDRVEKR